MPVTNAFFSGEPVEDMEVAKQLIAKYPSVDVTSLITIMTDQSQPESARIAAIYTLGFTDDDGKSCGALKHILNSENESGNVKDHAAEALRSIEVTH